MRPGPLLALAALAGCIGPASPDAAGEWHLGGSFTTERTQADIEAVCEAGAGGGPCGLMESWPEQFGFRFPSQPTCEEARAKIAQVPHTTARECARVEPSAGPEEKATVLERLKDHIRVMESDKRKRPPP